MMNTNKTTATIQINRKQGRVKKILRFISILLFLFGLLLLASYLYWWRTGDEIIKVPEIISVPENSDVSEEPVTEAKVLSHNVGPKELRYFSMENLGVEKARILPVGLVKNTNEIGTPIGIFDVGWFNESGKQDQIGKVIFLDGHNGGPSKDGIFRKLPEMSIGSTFTLERGDGLITKYSVISNENVKLKDFDDTKMSQILKVKNGKETVVMVSCTGKWIPYEKTYDARVIVIANRIK